MAAGSKRGRKAPPRARRKALAPRKPAVAAKSAEATLRQQLAEAREQQSATAEILKVIASSPADVQPVFEAIVQSARRLVGSFGAVVTRVQDGAFHLAAFVGDGGIESLRSFYPRPVSQGSTSAIAYRTKKPVSVADCWHPGSQTAEAREHARARGYRSLINVPMVRGDSVIGMINVSRREAGAFSDHHVGLLKTFADQAVIAIENVRLFNETKESLERQTATAEILKVIASSPSDVQPVFDAIVETARRLLGGFSATVTRTADDMIYLGAYTGIGESGDNALKGLFPAPLSERPEIARVVKSKASFYVADAEKDAGMRPEWREMARRRGFRSVLFVPMLRAGVVIGTINVTRREPGPFIDHQVELLKTFADQAVIAIENVRLFNETKEALERQTATAEILRVIASSPDDTQPVFDAIAESAKRLFGAKGASVTRVVSDRLQLAAFTSGTDEGKEAMMSVFSKPLLPSNQHMIAVRSGKPAFCTDTENDPEISPQHKVVARSIGYRSMLTVPMLREGVAIGTIAVVRPEAGPFTDHQISLLETFADQAVIAIENVRLFNETKEALERQTATAEILKVIASSPSDVQPVFDAIVSSAMRLLKGATAHVARLERDALHLVAYSRTDPEGAAALNRLYPLPVTSGTTVAEVLEKRTPLIVSDVQSDSRVVEEVRAASRVRGVRSFVMLPMVRNSEAIGTIVVNRREAGQFSNHEVELLKTFSDQAVIAIENVRLFNETKESLERQTASAEILQVISSSPTDVQPVFDAIVASAMRLFGAHSCIVTRVEGESLSLVAFSRTSPEVDEELRQRYPLPLSNSLAGQVIRAKKPRYISDVLADSDIPAIVRDNAGIRGFRGILSVPLIRAGESIGAINVTRREPGPFTDRQVEQLKTFADQAVIALENVRLFNETKESLERQTATAEILKVIASSPTDLQPVLDSIAENAARVCGAEDVLIWRVYGSSARIVAKHGPFHSENIGYERPLARGRVSDRAVIDRETVHVHDLTAAETEFPDARAGGLKWGVRTALATPLMREGVAIGAIHCRRMEVRPFTDKQIDLLKAFADQAVIAIENVRLFNETREALERQTATSDVLKAISRTTFDLDAVLRVLIESATRLAGASRGFIFRFDGEVARMVVSHNAPPDYVALIEANPISPGRSTLVGRALVECRPTHIPDVLADPEFQWNEAQRLGGFRSMLGVPMMRDGRPIGVIAMWSDEVKPFTEKQIELVTTFADQAVIAIENVRLFNETKESLERQTATAEILKVISRSPTDVQPVLDAIVQSAARLFVPWNAAIVMREGNFLHLRTSAGPRVLSREDKEAAQNRWPLPFDPEKSVTARVIADLQTRQILDTEAPDVTPGVKATGRAGKYRSIAWVPLVRDREGIGSIVLTHAQPGYVISEKQFALVRTFADQAVIAIENVRLFNETKEALERQTATAEILKVISQSTTDVQPVLEAIVGSAAKLFPQCNATVFMRDGGLLQLRAMDGATVNDRLREDLGRIYPVPFDPELSSSARAMVERRPNVCPDTEAPDVPEHIRRAGRAARFRSNTVVPLVRDDEGIGSIVLTNSKPGYALDKKQISLLQTFADQAVIAIENVRLFNETKEALERQTATAEILKVIADSPSDVQPVLEAVASSAGRLCEAKDVIVMLREGDHLRYRVHRGGISPAVPVGDTKRISRDWSAGRCAAEARQLHIHDILAAPDEFPDGSRMGKDAGYRTVLMTPLLREGVVLGVIGMRRAEVRPFEPRQIELINTFADQAVMAIENVRLFKELQSRTEALTKSVGQLTALGEVGQAISSTLDLDTVLQTIVSRAVQLTGLNGGTIYEFDERAGEFLLRAHENMPAELVEVYRSKPIRLGEGVVGSAAQKREALQVPDIQDPGYQTRYRDLLIRQGYRAILAVPLLREEQIIGALTVSRGEPGEFAPEVVELLKTFATQSAMAIQNARLFREIAEKSKQLEQASQHKSNFLASMSHELRTPLNAILGFNEMILGQVYGEVPADMQEPLADIQTSGKHLLRLINNVLDLAKIEAGRMELSLQDYSVHDTVESVRATLRPLAAEKGLEFLVAVPPELPLAYGDSGRITQCLMNLAGNSLKFTKAGKVEIAVTEKDGLLTYRVTDTGVGIPPDKIGSLFTEFKQTDATIASEYGGTGLGLSISKKFVEMHGGRIWIESELGKGSTFIFEIPLRVNVT